MKPGVDYTGVAVVMLCHDGQGNLLMHKRGTGCRDEHGKWDCGGGKVEYAEDLCSAVLREVKEEYGCEGIINQQLTAYSIFRKREQDSTHWVTTPFIIQVDRTQVKNNEPDMMEELGWYKLSELPKPYHPAFDIILEQHSEALTKFFK